MSESYYDEYKQRKQDGVWHFLNRLIAVLIVLASITFIICLFLPQLRNQKELLARHEQLAAELEAQNAIHEHRTRVFELLNHDKSYVEVLARDKLDLMKEGETIFRLDTTQATPSDSPGLKLRPQH